MIISDVTEAFIVNAHCERILDLQMLTSVIPL